MNVRNKYISEYNPGHVRQSAAKVETKRRLLGLGIPAPETYTIVEMVFFAVPIAFVGFPCWQAAMYHVLRIGEDFTEWDAPLSRRDDRAEPQPRSWAGLLLGQ